MRIFWRPGTGQSRASMPPTLGRYQLLGRLASGGMAEVYAAKVQSGVGFERMVALKVIHPHLAGEEEFVRMFIDEARTAMHLRHSNIVQVHDLLLEQDVYAIALEWVDGVDLGEAIARLREGRRIFPPEIIALIASEAAKGLHHAHERRSDDGVPLDIVHRDVTPTNVLLSFDGDVKVTDFGIARARSRLSNTRPGEVKGKLAYIAPEAYAGKPVDRRSDVFGLGIMLYELITGVQPFAGTTAAEIMYRVRLTKVTPPHELVPVYAPLASLAMSAMAPNPADRPQTAGELARALADVLSRLEMERGAFVRPTALADRLRLAFPERGLPRLGHKVIPSEIPTEDFQTEHLRVARLSMTPPRPTVTAIDVDARPTLLP